MDIRINHEGSKLTLELSGRLDTKTAPQLENVLDTQLDGVTELVLDFAGVEYISSAGLRILLKAQKLMNRQGSMLIRCVNEGVSDVLKITGFSNIFTIE